MNEKVKTFLCFFIVLFLFSSLSATHSFAAKQNFKIKKVKLNSEMNTQKTSGHSGGLIALSTKGKKKQRWTEIFVTYKTKLEWSDDVTLKYYVQLGSGSKAVVLSGEETYIEMKRIDPGLKVLLNSGFRRDGRVEEVLRLGINDFIEKPYTKKQLLKAVYNS